MTSCNDHYMLGAKHGFAQFMDGTAQSADRHFAQQSVDCPRNERIAQTMDRRGQSVDSGNPQSELKDAWIRQYVEHGPTGAKRGFRQSKD